MDRRASCFPTKAEDVGYDEVFDRAMWEAAEILSKRIDDDAIYGLARLKRTQGVDGHPSEHLCEWFEMQRKLKLSKQKTLMSIQQNLANRADPLRPMRQTPVNQPGPGS